MWLALLPLALSAERTAAVTLAAPDGGADAAEAPLPYRQEHPLTLGGREFVLVVSAQEEGEGARLAVALEEVRRSGQRKPLDSADAALPDRQEVTLSVSGRAPRGALPTRTATWTVSAAQAPTLTPPAREPAPDSKLRYVLAWADAGLADTVRSGRWDARDTLAARDDPSTQLTPFRVVKEFTGEILEVKAVPQDQAGLHCYFRPIADVNDWDRQFFVQRKDLAAVTTREVALAQPDGTGITLGAGAAVQPGGASGTWRVEIDGVSFEVPLPEDAVSWAYRPTGRFPAAAGAPSIAPSGGVLGETELGEVRDRSDRRRIDGLTGVAEPRVVTHLGCAALTLRVDPAQLEGADSAGSR